MMRQAAGTILSRVLITLMSMLVTMIAGHRLGAAGLGDISLIVLGITFIVLLSNVVGGGALVYLTSRVPLGRLLRPAYAWACITVVAAFAVMLVIPITPPRYRTTVVLLAALQSIYTIHLNILLGLERIRSYNRITTAQVLVLLVAFTVLTSREGPHDARAYVQASMVAFALTVVLSGAALLSLKRRPVRQDVGPVVPQLVKQGGMIQAANALQLLNYRLGYWLIEHFRGLASLGVYSVATQLAEGSWLAPRSLGTVLYSKVSNTSEAARQRDLTLTTFKASVAFALAVVIIVLLPPGHLDPRALREGGDRSRADRAGAGAGHRGDGRFAGFQSLLQRDRGQPAQHDRLRSRAGAHLRCRPAADPALRPARSGRSGIAGLLRQRRLPGDRFPAHHGCERDAAAAACG
jgi:O-antigen/teichoic acid export membrane protein